MYIGNFTLAHESICSQNILKHQNTVIKNCCIPLDIYVRTSRFTGKPTFFMTCVKTSWKAYLVPNFVFFTHGHGKCGFSVKRLSEHVEHQHVRKNIFVRVFWHLTIRLECILKTGSQNATPRVYYFFQSRQVSLFCLSLPITCRNKQSASLTQPTALICIEQQDLAVYIFWAIFLPCESSAHMAYWTIQLCMNHDKLGLHQRSLGYSTSLCLCSTYSTRKYQHMLIKCLPTK